MGRAQVGEMVQVWRAARRRSQLDLALEVGVSARHLSFVETGRSRPSPELLLALASCLDVPLRDRNAMLLAAGYAPRYSHRALDDPAMRAARTSIQRMLDAHEPYPGVAIDRHGNVVLANDAARRLVASLPPEVTGPPLNIYRSSLHPLGLAASTINFAEWAAYMLDQLERSHSVTGDTELGALLAEVRSYPNVAAIERSPNTRSWVDLPLLVPLRLDRGDHELSLLTTLTTFGTPQDVTLAELTIELFFPADDETADALRADAPRAGS
jgi:transcriptional regulator with XRE-family HTH domain